MRLYQITTKTPQFEGQCESRDITGRPYYRGVTPNRDIAMARWRAAVGYADVWSWGEDDDGAIIDGSGCIEAQR